MKMIRNTLTTLQCFSRAGMVKWATIAWQALFTNSTKAFLLNLCLAVENVRGFLERTDSLPLKLLQKCLFLRMKETTITIGSVENLEGGTHLRISAPIM